MCAVGRRPLRVSTQGQSRRVLAPAKQQWRPKRDLGFRGWFVQGGRLPLALTRSHDRN